MARSYQHISDNEKEILELKSQGMTLREIGEKFGFTYKQVHNFITRYNKKQRMIEAVQAIHRKGKTCENQDCTLPPSIQKLDKLAQARYIMASKDRYIKRIEMENKLMKDFLTHTERK